MNGYMGCGVKTNIINMEQKRMEQALSIIGSKISVATELSRKAKKLTANCELYLMALQKEIEDLYISLE